MARATVSEAWGSIIRLARDRPGYLDAVYDEVAARGPLTASELSDPGARAGSWWGWGDGKRALEALFWAGRLGALRKPSFERVYDVIERVVPAPVLALPTPDEAEAHRRLLTRAAQALGVATAADLADYFRIRMPVARPRLAELVEAGALEPVDVEGWSQPAYLHPGARVPRRIEAAALLSPFDPIVWARDRTDRLFGFHLRLELYTPAHQRRHGYYVLPFLLGDRLVARVDLKSDRRGSALLVLAAWIEDHADPARVVEPLSAQLREMANWLGLDRVVVADRGDLSAALAPAVGARTG
jgi:uncharacterized protein YcaQ